ncbi:hypothetical protein ABL78_2830 [Leptomonas seymouri]|uniref:Uncharacterized protein n=1 Tax=Leptomonas seymouri TaxID=5684 RepID=A0A0N1PCJ4_LEPSE|nr:hypothetical protein ABL78_2830 [Leptomonas seymouri]|eukprot:KPI88054.1 hypothetical protein ABL78_2830 [Leptomonas seymouri]
MRRIAHRFELIVGGGETYPVPPPSSQTSSANPVLPTVSSGTPGETSFNSGGANDRRHEHRDNHSLNVNRNGRRSGRRTRARLIPAPEGYESLPQALPTESFYRRFPRAIGPLANVVFTSREECQPMLDACEPVEVVKSWRKRDLSRNRLCQEDINQGGFLIYQPKGKSPQYFKRRGSSGLQDVYGSASYTGA